MDNWANWSYQIGKERELAHRRAEQIGPHLRELQLGRDAATRRERREVRRTATWLMRVAQAASAWLF